MQATNFRYGTQSGVYTTTIDVGNVTSWPLTLTPGQRYFFVVQAYNTSSLLSAYSAEVVYDAPSPPSIGRICRAKCLHVSPEHR